jgi:DNA polymerase III alpha subunit
VEQADDPDEPMEALAIARRLADTYGDRLYVSLVFHGSATDKVVNRGRLAIAQRLELGVVATNAVRFATAEEALPHTVLAAIREGRRADGLMTQPGVGADLPTLALDGVRAQGYLKSAAAMWRLFGNQRVDSSVLERLEDLAQLLALWRPGAWGKEREQGTWKRGSRGSARPTCILKCPEC